MKKRIYTAKTTDFLMLQPMLAERPAIILDAGAEVLAAQVGHASGSTVGYGYHVTAHVDGCMYHGFSSVTTLTDFEMVATRAPGRDVS